MEIPNRRRGPVLTNLRYAVYPIASGRFRGKASLDLNDVAVLELVQAKVATQHNAAIRRSITRRFRELQLPMSVGRLPNHSLQPRKIRSISERTRDFPSQDWHGLDSYPALVIRSLGVRSFD